jgi:uncharacterized RDD family membrane protein YckC
MTMLNHDLAARGDRLIAQFLDSLVAVLVIIVSARFSNLSTKIGEIVRIFGILAALFYILCADGLKGGQSYGKRIVGICVIDATSGKPCTFIKSLLRNITLAFLGLIDWVFIFSEKRQRLGDKLANTIVVSKNSRSNIY